jgi:glutamate-5-semialdehyde dehydrogenase
MSDLRAELIATCDRARVASRSLAALDRSQKDAVLETLARLLLDRAADVIAVNREDVAEAKAHGLSEAMIDRLVLDERRMQSMADGVREIAQFDDPVGRVVGMQRRPSGIQAGQVRVPLGVIAMIYESRPNVTIDAAALCFKSGNAVLLRGGKEAKRSNAALGQLVREALGEHDVSPDAVQIIGAEGREGTQILITLSGKIDLLIPRGGEGLIRYVVDNARVPVVQHYKGVCHLFVDDGADLDMAFRLIENGKSRPGVCNALECVLVHESCVTPLLKKLTSLVDAGIEIRADERCLPHCAGATLAKGSDWGEEFLAKILAVRAVSDLDGALAHITRYGSNHTEAICTPSYDNAQRFLREVDASCVLVNASTRFNDGNMLGLGAEVGISTSKLHAYGPMGLSSLTTLKWIVQGNGNVR